jgi:hypothetical protein
MGLIGFANQLVLAELHAYYHNRSGCRATIAHVRLARLMSCMSLSKVHLQSIALPSFFEDTILYFFV